MSNTYIAPSEYKPFNTKFVPGVLYRFSKNIYGLQYPGSADNGIAKQLDGRLVEYVDGIGNGMIGQYYVKPQWCVPITSKQPDITF